MNWLLIPIGIVCALLAAIICTMLHTVAITRWEHTSKQPKPPSRADKTPLYNESLILALRIPTVTGSAEFARFHEFLRRRYPLVHRRLVMSRISDSSIVYRWRQTSGGHDKLPILFCAHTDVAPPGPGWSHEPFAGDISDGFIWGRGAVDCKSPLIGLFEAAEALIAAGFSPERDIYFALGHDEESGGHSGAAAIARLFRDSGVFFELVLDEGEPVCTASPWISRPAALISIAEKGILNLRISAVSPGGRASAPPPIMAVDHLAEALRRIGKYHFPARVTPTVRAYLSAISPYTGFFTRVTLQHPRLFKPLITSSFSPIPFKNALIRTTSAPTAFRSGSALNALPRHADAVISYRLLQGDSCSDVVQTVRLLTRDLKTSVEVLSSSEPSLVSPSSSAQYRAVERALRETFGQIAIFPSLLTSGSDGGKYECVSDCVLRISPLMLDPEDALRVHGSDERLPLDAMPHAVEFYMSMLQY